MTGEKFTELVDLYLDEEISGEDLKRLRAELAADPERKQRFLERRCLHRATGLALAPKTSRGTSKRRRHAKRRRRSSVGSDHRHGSSQRRVKRSAGEETLRTAPNLPNPLPRWILGTGMAASLLVASVLLRPVFRDSLHGSWFANLMPSQTPEAVIGDDLLAEVRASDLERYRKIQARADQRQASLVAQMRLLGLRPELTPADKQLRAVEPSTLEPERNEISRAEHLARLQKLRPIPEPKLFRSQVNETDRQSGWGRGGFDVHLVGY